MYLGLVRTRVYSNYFTQSPKKQFNFIFKNHLQLWFTHDMYIAGGGLGRQIPTIDGHFFQIVRDFKAKFQNHS